MQKRNIEAITKKCSRGFTYKLSVGAKGSDCKQEKQPWVVCDRRVAAENYTTCYPKRRDLANLNFAFTSIQDLHFTTAQWQKAIGIESSLPIDCQCYPACFSMKTWRVHSIDKIETLDWLRVNTNNISLLLKPKLQARSFHFFFYLQQTQNLKR